MRQVIAVGVIKAVNKKAARACKVTKSAKQAQKSDEYYHEHLPTQS